MPENNAQLKPTSVPQKDAADYDRAHVPMAEEFDKAKWTLPPWQPVVVALVVVAIVVGLLAWLTRAKPQGKATIDNINVVQLQGDNVLVAVNVTLHNAGEKALVIHDIKAQVKTDKGDFLPALLPETIIAPRTQQAGTTVFSFPVTKDLFDKRKSITLTIQPYDQKAVVLTK
jgi:hypothetical protein